MGKYLAGSFSTSFLRLAISLLLRFSIWSVFVAALRFRQRFLPTHAPAAGLCTRFQIFGFDVRTGGWTGRGRKCRNALRSGLLARLNEERNKNYLSLI